MNILENFYCSLIPELEKVKIPPIAMYSDMEAILVYFKDSKFIETIIRNVILNLGNKWSYTIVCSPHNYKFVYYTFLVVLRDYLVNLFFLFLYQQIAPNHSQNDSYSYRNFLLFVDYLDYF